MPNTALNRTGATVMTNKSGGSVAKGDVVIVDVTTATSFTTTTSSGYANGIPGVVLEPNGIANNSSGLVATTGWVPQINLSGSASLGDLVKTHSVAKQGVRHAAPAVTGDFAQVLGTGTTPPAILFGFPVQVGGAAGAMVLIASNVLSVAAANVSFAAISGAYNHLQLLAQARGTASATLIIGGIRLNGDTGANYDFQEHSSSGTGISAAEGLAQTSWQIVTAAGTSPANAADMIKMDIPCYALTTFQKTASIVHGEKRTTSTGGVFERADRAHWRNTAAITQIDIFPSSGNWLAGSAFYLYGIT